MALLAAGADAMAVESDGWTPLHCSEAGRRDEVIDALVAAGADVNAMDDDGRTSLHVAARKGREEFVRRLLAACADPSIEDDEGNSPVMEAIEKGRDGTAALLCYLGKCKSVNWQLARGKGRRVKLHWAKCHSLVLYFSRILFRAWMRPVPVCVRAPDLPRTSDVTRPPSVAPPPGRQNGVPAKFPNSLRRNSLVTADFDEW
jgi:ankyrin repeat protein